MSDLSHMVDPFAQRSNVMNILAMDRVGNVLAASTSDEAKYVFQTVEMDTFEEQPRLHVPLQRD